MDKPPAQNFKRRNYFINKKLQSRFMAGFSLAVLLGLVANLILVYYLIDSELSQAMYKSHIKIKTTSEIAAPILWKLGAFTIPSILAISAVVGYYLTRKIELPLLKMKEAIEKTGQGDLTHVLPDDIPGSLPRTFNAMTNSLKERFRGFNASVKSMEEEFARLEGKKGLDRQVLAGTLEEFSRAREKAWRKWTEFRL